MDAKKKPVENPTLTELGVDPTVGQKVAAISQAPARTAGAKIEDDGEAHLKIVELLTQRKVI
jgi:electron transfer flavoprotein beta subunit